MRTLNNVQTWSRRVLSLMLFLAVALVALPATAWAAIYDGDSDPVGVGSLTEGDVLREGAEVTFPTGTNTTWYYIQVEGLSDVIDGVDGNSYHGVVSEGGIQFQRKRYANSQWQNRASVNFSEGNDGFVYNGVTTGSSGWATTYTYHFSQAKGIEVTGTVACVTEKVYDGTTDAAIDEEASDYTIIGVGAEEDVELMGVYEDENVGEGKEISFSLAGDDANKYYLNPEIEPRADGKITPRPVKVMGVAAVEKQYDGTDDVIEFDYSLSVVDNVVEGDDVEVEEVKGKFSDEQVGDDKDVTFSSIALGGEDKDNYEVVWDKSQTMTKGNITLCDVTVTADPQTKTFGDDDPELTATVTGTVGEDTIEYTVTREEGEDAGQYTITPAGEEVQDPYKVTFVTSTLTINRADLTADMFEITFPEDLVYDGQPKRVTATLKSEYADKGVGSFEIWYDTTDDWPTQTDTSDVNTYKVYLSVERGQNYNAANTLTTALTAGEWSFEVTPKTLKVVGVSADDKVYDGTTVADIVGTAALDGVVERDEGTRLVRLVTDDAVATFASMDVAEGIEVTFSGYALAGTRAFNYTIEQPAPTTASIARRSVYVSGVLGVDKSYDGTDAATLDFKDAKFANVVEGESLELDQEKTTASARFSDANVGEDKLINFVPVIGEDAGGYYKNYKLNTILGQTQTKADILAVVRLVVTALDQDAVTDRPIDVSVGQVRIEAYDADGNPVDTSAVSVGAVTLTYDEGKVKEPGTTPITPSDVMIVDADGNDVTGFYKEPIEYVPATITVTEAPDRWERIWGENGYSTMAAIVQCEGVFTPEDTSTVVVASRANWQDPLGATALAGAYDAPLLLAGGPKDALPSATKKELQRLKPNKVVVIGPESIVSKSTFEEIKKAAGTGNVQRINGATPVVRADNMLKSTSNWKGGTAVVATQNSFKDSLSATPVSYAQKYPVVFVGTKVSSTEGGKLGSSTLSALKSKGIKKCIIVGGPIAVSRQVEKQLKSAGMTYERWYGQDSLETSAVIATRAMDQFGMTTEHVSVARSDGNNYVDALAGTALTGRLNSVLILANSQWKIGSGTRAFDAIRDRIQGKLVHGHVYGGTGAISEQYMDYFRQVQ